MGSPKWRKPASKEEKEHALYILVFDQKRCRTRKPCTFDHHSKRTTIPRFAQTPMRHGRTRCPKARCREITRQPRPLDAMPGTSYSNLPASTRVCSHATAARLWPTSCEPAASRCAATPAYGQGDSKPTLGWLHSGGCAASEDALVHADERENAGETDLRPIKGRKLPWFVCVYVTRLSR